MGINRKEIKSILLIRTDRIGEFILSLPVLKALKEKFPLARISFMVSPVVRDIIQDSPLVNEIIIYKTGRVRFLDDLKLIFKIRQKRFDLAVILNPKKEFNLITFFAGIPFRLGYARKCGFLLTHTIEDRKYLGQKHEVDYNLDLLRKIGIEAKDRMPAVILSQKDKAVLEVLLSEHGVSADDLVISLHPWTSDPIKQWPVENFIGLAKKITRGLKQKVVIIGGPEEAERSLKYFNNLGEDVINFTGKTTLMQLAALLKRSRLLISADSGPVHLASSVGTAVVAIFRNDLAGKNSLRWGPLSPLSRVIEKASLSDIAIEEVYRAAEEILNK